MNSRSAKITSERPFYDLHAEAYDALITDPVEPWVEWIDQHLRDVGHESASVLDAGCGTGRHAAALIDRGHRLTLMDAAPRLLAIAADRCPGSRAILADICAPSLTETFDAVTCRGVLNDLVEDAERDQALDAFAMLTSAGGVLVLDVRESEASRSRADGAWHTKDAELADGGRLKFSGRSTWRAGRLVVEERYELADTTGVASPTREYTFEMRPWTTAELESRLRRAGFQSIEIQPGIGRRTTDRLLATARR
ncbi:class I SAM-dependent DNA methyltransferase [Kribbella sp. NPDC049227]|uniref:class I SAM-dependent DNA methyltransferase n=1 Tax=Kribbella sp. NPDC049227 TaxID=3364113 RepID=UPI003715BD5C